MHQTLLKEFTQSFSYKLDGSNATKLVVLENFNQIKYL